MGQLQMLRCDVKGHGIAFEDRGTGIPVVLLHGFPMDHRLWEPQVVALVQQGFRCITPDLPGFGESDPLVEATMEAYAEHIEALLDHLELDRAVIGGMSMGGYVTLEAMRLFPHRFDAALLMVTRALADDQAGREKRMEMKRWVQEGQRTRLETTFLDVLLNQKEAALALKVHDMMKCASDEGLVGGLEAMMNRSSRGSVLANWSLPCLILAGNDDRAIPHTFSEAMAEQMVSCDLVLLDGAGHLANLEHADAFNQALLSFFQALFG
jgi:pimeloyl-ACP methyl ester carboxylesterase